MFIADKMGLLDSHELVVFVVGLIVMFPINLFLVRWFGIRKPDDEL